MKDREAVQNTQSIQSQRARESAPRTDLKTARMPDIPLQVFARLLDGDTDWPDLPEPLLRALAEGVGNSGLTALLRGGGEGGPGLHTPEPPAGEDGLSPNEIRTTPPRLAGPPVRDGEDPVRPRPVRPRSLKERGLR